MNQSITSAKTSQNTLARGFRVMEHQPFTINLDLGGGRYTQGTEFLAFYGITNLILDPFNQPPEHNAGILEHLWVRPADTGTCFNVLNVIKEPEIRLSVLRQLKVMVKRNGLIYIQCYRGLGDTPQPTSKGWQENRPLNTYFDEVREVFKSFGTRRGVIEILNS